MSGMVRFVCDDPRPLMALVWVVWVALAAVAVLV